MMGNGGQGFIGIVVVLVLLLFFFAGFYVTLEMLFNNLIESWITDSDTQAFYSSYIRILWLSLPVLFLLSITIWGIVQTQSYYNLGSIAGVWIVILFGFTIFSSIYVSFDKLIMKDLLSLLPVDSNYVSVYEGLVKPLWRTAPFVIYGMFIFFGLFMASTYAEKGGSTFRGAYPGGRM